MESERFDQLSRLVASGPTRRGVLSVLVALGLSAGTDGEARKRRNKKRKCKKTCGECRKCQKGTCRKRPNGRPCSDGGACQGGVCRCPCPAPAICGGPNGECCDPEGIPCTTFDNCCAKQCDFLEGGGTCTSGRGLFCDAEFPCCCGLECIDSRCDGCLGRAVVCTPTVTCCFSACSSGVCLSAVGERCVYDADCRACYLDGQCENACVDGVCAL